ncbi:uridine-cytidine kinase 2 [Brachionus plicatilis]|uniref:uridine/cytidine kinase n=1 Tax=Brachionus plicatilis TaxID=10195 RepID=A0A3M7RUD5_BRAPC|nr:uridine-cytidine kinase 2 [Brachionus plicatilis]
MLKKKEPFLIGVAGGISSGKSTVCKKIIEELAKLNSQYQKHVLVISLDSFYKPLSPEELLKLERGELNLDHPSAFDDELAYETLINIINGKTVQIPLYEKKRYTFSGETLTVTAEKTPDILIIEGILVFYYPKIRELCQMKLFVDCDADTRLSRRVLRDMSEYNRHLDQILSYYQKYVKPAFEEFCLPTKKYADVIIPRGAENTVAINLIVQHLNDYLNSSRNESPKQEINNLLTVSMNSQSTSSMNSSNSSSPNKTPSKRTDIPYRPH